MKKLNEDIASWLPPRKEPELEERREVIHKGKLSVGQGDDESSVHGSHHTLVQSGKNSFHKGSYREETQTLQQSYGEESYLRRPHHSWPDHAKNKEVEVDKEV
jgi:hypothetical protein